MKSQKPFRQLFKTKKQAILYNIYFWNYYHQKMVNESSIKIIRQRGSLRGGF